MTLDIGDADSAPPRALCLEAVSLPSSVGREDVLDQRNDEITANVSLLDGIQNISVRIVGASACESELFLSPVGGGNNAPRTWTTL